MDSANRQVDWASRMKDNGTPKHIRVDQVGSLVLDCQTGSLKPFGDVQ